MKLSDLGTLIDAAAAREDRLTAVIGRLGADAVTRALVVELVERADLVEAGVSRAVTVEFALEFAARTTRYAVRLHPDGLEHGPEVPDRPDVTVRQELPDLVRGVFGPRAARRNGTRAIVWHDDTPISKWSEVPQVAPVVQRLLRGTTHQDVDLAGSMLRLGSDKWGLHYYTDHYDRYFRPYRDSPVVLLELGVGGFLDPEVGGGSLLSWHRYFHRGIVCGVDLADKPGVQRQRVVVLRGDQSDPSFIDTVIGQVGRPDIVIDDASHRSQDVIASFRALFPYLRPGGLYVIEDLQTSYWPGFGGTSRDLNTPSTSMGFLKQLVDGINYEEIGAAANRSEVDTDRQVVGVYFHHNLAVVEKGRNEEGSLPDWHPARAE